MKYRVVPFLGLLVVFGLLTLVSCINPEPTDIMIRVRANRDNVTVRQGENNLPLTAPNLTELAPNDQVTVDDLGWALLALSDSLVVEMIRDGQLQIQEMTLNEQTALLTLAMNGGAVLNNLDVEGAINARLQIEGEYATVAASGTIFLVVREQHTPLEWVIALEAGPSDLTVTADNTPVVLTAGKAVWVAPDGAPGPVVDANIAAVNDWFFGLRDGRAQLEMGEAVWAPADLAITAAEFPDPPPVGTPIDVQHITVTLDPAGTYERMDCNGDGQMDLRARNGRFQFDLRQIIGQKRAIDVEIINLNTAQAKNLTGFNPANDVVTAVDGTNSPTTGDGGQILSLRSEVEPFHFAELVLEDGCFSGLTLLPPGGDQNGDPATITPTATPTPSPTATPTTSPSVTPIPVCVPSPPFGWTLYSVRAGDTMFNLANRTGVTIPMIKQVNCWYSNTIYIGQQLWLPFIPPTLTPTPLIDPPLTCEPLFIDITGVVYNSYVTFQTIDFPLNRTFSVSISYIEGEPRTTVGTILSHDGGSFTTSVSIPESVYNLSPLILEIESIGPEVSYCTSVQFDNIDLGSPNDITVTPTNTPTSSPTSIPANTPTHTPTHTPTPIFPDLSVTLIDGPFLEGDYMMATIIVRNDGSARANPFSVLAKLNDFEDRIEIGDGLAPNSDSGEIDVLWENGAACRYNETFPGWCTVVITADFLNVIQESNEFNNIHFTIRYFPTKR